MRAIQNVRRICEEHLRGLYDLEVVDIYKNLPLARGDQIIAAPRLIKRLPAPLRRLIGDMSDEQRVLVGLDIRPQRAGTRRWLENDRAGRRPMEELRRRLQEAEDTINAIREGHVEALVVSAPEGEQIYTLRTADQPYRLMVEQMREGALTLSADGTILYCNQRFAELMGRPPERIAVKPFGSSSTLTTVDAATRAELGIDAGRRCNSKPPRAPRSGAAVVHHIEH